MTMPAILKSIIIASLLLGILYWLFVPPATVSKDGAVEISLGTFGNPEQVDVYKQIVRLFEKDHPGIRVDLRTPSSGGYLEKLKTELAGRVAPDVTWVDVSSFYSFSDKQVFRPLDEFASQDPGFKRDSYFPAILEAFSYRGKLYALPKSCGSLILFFNKDHFDQAGLSYPDETWTWDTVADAAAKLNRDYDGDGRLDRYAILFTNSTDILWQYGVEVLSPDGSRCTLDSPGTVEACQRLYDLVYVHHASPTSSQMGSFGLSSGGGGRSGSTAGVFDLFPMQAVSMITTDLVLSIAYQKASFNWDAAVQPHGIRKGGYLNGAGYAMNARTRHPEEAWQLIKFLAGPAVQQLRARGGDSIPSMPLIAQSPDFLANPNPPASRGAVLQQAEWAVPPPYHPRWPSILQELSLMIESFMAEENPLPIPVAIGNAAHQIERILEGKD